MSRRWFALALWAVVVIVGRPASAQAWFEWLDPLSGPGPSKGLHMEARLVCFQDPASEARELANRAAAEMQFALDLTLAAAKASPPPNNSLTTDAITQAGKARQVAGGSISAAVANELRDAADRLANSANQLAPPEWQQASAAWRSASAMWAASAKAARATSDDATSQNFTGGYIFSACSLHPGRRRRASIDVGFRMLHFTDSATTNAFAGGNEIKLTSIVPAFSWRVFSDPNKQWLDFVDAGMGAGMYWFTADGDKAGSFPSISGVIVEPVRLDFHAPSALTSRPGLWWTAIPNFRFGYVVFPGGFGPNAFGPRLAGEKASRIPAEWLKSFSVTANLEPIAKRLSRRLN